jgi:hypothetical protein
MVAMKAMRSVFAILKITIALTQSDESSEHCYTDIVDALRRYGHALKADIEALWRRIAFSRSI